MIPPKTALLQLLLSARTGALLGILWGFLAPLGRRRQTLADSLFVLLTAAGLCWLGFGVCGGDLRVQCLGMVFFGAVLEEKTLGRLLDPAFYGFWSILARIRRAVLSFWKKFFKMTKNIFASAGKWVTIGRKKSTGSKPFPGGVTYDGSKR